jgi:ferrous iron transport protein A
MDSRPRWHETPVALPLASLPKGTRGVVAAVSGTDGEQIGDVAGSTISRRLLEIGFLPGERIEIIEQIWPGGDPIAVRVGASIFALRRREAQAVMVHPDPL